MSFLFFLVLLKIKYFLPPRNMEEKRERTVQKVRLFNNEYRTLFAQNEIFWGLILLLIDKVFKI